MSQMKLGVMAPLEIGAETTIKHVSDFGLPTCQVVCWNPALFTQANADALLKAMDAYDVEVTTLWVGTPGEHIWDFVRGPELIGLVPLAFQQARIDVMKQGADFARKIGVPSITTHAGFIPENMTDPLYPPLLEAVYAVASHCAALGLEFWFETGQETPVVLLRVIEAMQKRGLNNLGINLDPANLLMYGKANPNDALDVFGRYVRGVHAKDGEYPTNGAELGVEKPLGQGRVDFPTFIGKLKALKYQGALTIEREISGDQQIADIRQAIEVLSALV